MRIAESEGRKPFESTRLDNAMAELRTDMSISDPSARMVMLVAKFNETLTKIGMDDYLDNNPKGSIKYITEALHPPQLRAKVREDINANDTLSKDFLAFVEHIQFKASVIASAADCDRALQNEKNGGHTSKKSQTSHQQGKASGNSSKNDREPPLCIYDSCKKAGKKNWFKDCKACPDSERAEVLENWRKQKNKNTNKKKKAKDDDDKVNMLSDDDSNSTGCTMPTSDTPDRYSLMSPKTKPVSLLLSGDTLS